MYRTLHDVIAPVDELPMLPNFGKKKKKTNKQPFEDHLISMGKIVNIKSKKITKKSELTRLLNRINKKIQSDLKKQKQTLSLRMVKHCLDYYNMKDIDYIPLKKRWAQLMKKHRKSIQKVQFKKDRKTKPVIKKEGKKAKSYVTHGKKGPRKAPKYSKFGSYWDNTQLTYAPGCATQQCAGTSGGQMYPYEGDFTPYYPIKGNAFGGVFRDTFKGIFGEGDIDLDKIENRLEKCLILSDRKSGLISKKLEAMGGEWTKKYPLISQSLIARSRRLRSKKSMMSSTRKIDLAKQNRFPFSRFGSVPMGQGVSRNYCENGMQCGSFPNAIERALPFTF